MSIHPALRRLSAALLAISLLLMSACTMSEPELPRYTALPLFKPHRTDFTCIYQADVVPPIDPEAERWHQEAMALTSYNLWEQDRDYKKAAELWSKAAERKHWKAQVNLSSLYLTGQGVPRDEEKAIQLVEEASRWGVPDAWDLLGKYHMQGMVGLKRDATVAYAFWQKAAEMGSPGAQAYLGRKLIASYDDPKNGFWANETVGFKMLHCAFDQGYGQAAYALGIIHGPTQKRENKPKALYYFHEGVKFGSEDCASALRIAFNVGPLNGEAPFIDKERERRYQIFMDALRVSPDLRFPNLDRVLPLPPAELPKWDGNKKSLLDAAKPVQPKIGPQKVSLVYPHDLRDIGYTGIDPQRYVIPAGYALPRWRGAASHPGVPVAESGYYQPVLADNLKNDPLLKLNSANHPFIKEPALTPPAFFKTGEILPDFKRSFLYFERPVLLGGMTYRFFGPALRLPEPETHPAVRAGLWREIELAAGLPSCKGDQPCPQAGIWLATPAKKHPAYARQGDPRWRQAFLVEGEAFPRQARFEHIGIGNSDLNWHLLEKI